MEKDLIIRIEDIELMRKWRNNENDKGVFFNNKYKLIAFCPIPLDQIFFVYFVEIVIAILIIIISLFFLSFVDIF